MKKTARFNYKREIKQNPYTGIMSFQHFNGEKLYSDCLCKNSLASVETENFECYPIPNGVEENGREQGFYPESTIAYIRILWKEFEPEQGKFNYDFVQNIFDDAKEHNQVVAFRLMPHSTCERDDVPYWLKALMDCPKRPNGERVKLSPKDDRYLPIFSKAVKAFGEKFDKNPTLYSMDISIVGAWGEGEGWENYPEESLNDLVDTYIKYFPNTHLIGQLCNGRLLHYIYNKRPVGYRGDGVGLPKLTDGLYYDWMDKVPSESWKTAPVSFEAYWWLTEWHRRGWDLDKIIDKTLKWHMSTFNPKSFPIPYEWKEKIEYWNSKMGYHFVIQEVSFDVDNNKKANINLSVKNVGVAPIYTRIPLKFKLKNEYNEYIFETDIDIRKWLDLANETIELDLSKIKCGKYTLEIGINGEDLPTVYFATDADFDNGYYKLLGIEV